MALLLMMILSDASRIPAQQSCDVLEVNHVMGVDGRHCFTQVIVWNWKPEVRRHHVDAWWMVDALRLGEMPRRVGDVWRVRRKDGLIVTARVYRERTTTYDPERDDKDDWHESRRRFR
jgi:hypothetical protein